MANDAVYRAALKVKRIADAVAAADTDVAEAFAGVSERFLRMPAPKEPRVWVDLRDSHARLDFPLRFRCRTTRVPGDQHHRHAERETLEEPVIVPLHESRGNELQLLG